MEAPPEEKKEQDEHAGQKHGRQLTEEEIRQREQEEEARLRAVLQKVHEEETEVDCIHLSEDRDLLLVFGRFSSLKSSISIFLPPH